MGEINSNLSDTFAKRELEKRSIVKKIPDMFSKGINLDYILKLCCDSKLEITMSSTMGECIETHFYKLILNSIRLIWCDYILFI